MHKGELFFENLEILILGGGDGALLNEVLKENPKFVTMIEVEEEENVFAEIAQCA